MAKKSELKETEPGFALGRENYIYLIIGFIIIIVGFILMIGGKSKDPNVFNEQEIFSFRRITLAPVIVFRKIQSVFFQQGIDQYVQPGNANLYLFQDQKKGLLLPNVYRHDTL